LVSKHLEVSPALQEDLVWKEHIAPALTGTPENVRAICHYGFTEMLNNVIDHSQSPSVSIQVERTAGRIKLLVLDSGIGVFRKIREALQLENDHQAAIELTKGKLTTDRSRHTGEGIFFTARVFDVFVLSSGTITLVCRPGVSDFWLENVAEAKSTEGTFVSMEIDENSKRTTREVFERFSRSGGSYDFDRTVLALRLETESGGPLVSRSQAKRLLSRLDRFREVILDFDGVPELGPAFADEVFRVFAREHPGVLLLPLHANAEVAKMIDRARKAATEEP